MQLRIVDFSPFLLLLFTSLRMCYNLLFSCRLDIL